ncbi:MAG: ribonuclease HII [candidate division WOR-3 bacterium]
MENLDRRLVPSNALVCGVDEVGRGAIAGPVVAAAVIIPPGYRIYGVNDSKLLSAKQREELAEVIKKRALAIGIGAAGTRLIEKENIAQATFRAMRLAVNKAVSQLEHGDRNRLIVLADGWRIPGTTLPCIGIRQGDRRSQAIACASIIAKVFRDQMMVRLDRRYPGYGFARHKGYGTAAHIQALKKLGVSNFHRRTFEPVKNSLSG